MGGGANPAHLCVPVHSVLSHRPLSSRPSVVLPLYPLYTPVKFLPDHVPSSLLTLMYPLYLCTVYTVFTVHTMCTPVLVWNTLHFIYCIFRTSSGYFSSHYSYQNPSISISTTLFMLFSKTFKNIFFVFWSYSQMYLCIQLDWGVPEWNLHGT